MDLLVVDSIRVRHGKMEVLHGVSLNIAKGSITAVIGHNGGGKTTAMGAIAGLLRVASGSIVFKGEFVTNMPPEQVVDRGISLVPTDRKLFPFLSVRDNLRMGAYAKRAWPKRQANLAFVYGLFPKLSEIECQEARTLSGGEQQMLVVGRALMSEPELLLLDEPSTGLAPLLVNKLFENIQDIRKRGLTVLIAEQSAAKVLSMVDRGYVMENGEIVLEGGGRELTNNPLVVEAYLRV